MKITEIDIIELRVPGWRGDSFDGSRDDCVIRVHTDEGITGIAEIDSVPGAAGLGVTLSNAALEKIRAA